MLFQSDISCHNSWKWPLPFFVMSFNRKRPFLLLQMLHLILYGEFFVHRSLDFHRRIVGFTWLWKNRVDLCKRWISGSVGWVYWDVTVGLKWPQTGTKKGDLLHTEQSTAVGGLANLSWFRTFWYLHVWFLAQVDVEAYFIRCCHAGSGEWCWKSSMRRVCWIATSAGMDGS